MKKKLEDLSLFPIVMSSSMDIAGIRSTLKQITSSINYYINDVWDQEGDNRIVHYPMMSSGPWSVLTAIAIYLYIVKIYGPQVMKNRSAYKIRDIMVCYNFLMVFLSGWMFYEGSRFLKFGLDTWGCPKVNYGAEDPATRRFLFVAWLFFFSKIIEFSDTIFMILRKKYDHVTNLHVIHHSVVPFSVWMGLKFAPIGLNAWFPLINSFVHSVMYSYYGLSAIAARLGIEKMLHIFKPWMTRLQMGQFCLAIIHCLYFIAHRDCRDFPRTFLVLNLGNSLLFLGLFFNFYRKTFTLDERMKVGQKSATDLSKDPLVCDLEQKAQQIKSQ